MAGTLPIVVGSSITAARSTSALLAAGLCGIFILLSVLVWTRFGQAKPVAKCVVLSLLAHVVLLIYAYSSHVLDGPPGRWTGQVVKVRLRDASDSREAAPHSGEAEAAWQQPGLEGVPLLLDAPPQPPAVAEGLKRPEQSTDAAAELSEPDADQPSATSAPPQLTDLLEQLPADSSADAPIVPTPASPEPMPTVASLSDDSASMAPPDEAQSFVTMTRDAPPRRLGDGQFVPQSLQARLRSNRLEAAQPFGATANSEAAVAAALRWLASAQSADGRWDADLFGAGRETKTLGHDRRGAGAQADMGITGLALLAFLGSGETHLAGPHRETVQHGLEFVLSGQASDGSLAGNAELFAAMYCHGMAALAVSEAYALSGDERLLPGLQKALHFTITAQNTAGGWRYRPQEPTDPGDMSQFGWQLMTLKSAEMGGIAMPDPTRVRMVRFLQSCSLGKRRGLAGYRPGDGASRTMTAEALVCRYFLDAENSPEAVDEAATYLMDELPQQRTANFYYWYYATLALFQRQGNDWQRWNEALQAELLARQRWDGTFAGSFDPNDLWGGYGGRVYSTALATLCLEVYYRYLPLHGRENTDSRLTDRPGQPGVAR